MLAYQFRLAWKSLRRNPILSVLLLAVLAGGPLAAQDDAISGVLSSFAYGYDVAVWINGTALPQIDGGDSDSTRIFSVDHPMKARMPPDAPGEAKAMFCLLAGENRIRVKFERADSGRPLEVKVEIPDLSDEPVFVLKSQTADGADREFTFEIAEGAPPVEVGDADL